AWGLLTFAVTAALVTLMTLRVPAYPDGWTYMTDATRYLAPAYPFILLALADTARRRGHRPAAAAALLLAVCGASVLAYRAGQVALYVTKNANAMPSGPVPRREIRTAFAAVRAAPRGATPVVYCDASALRRSIAMMAGAAAAVACDGRSEPVLRARAAADGTLLTIGGR